MKDEAAEIPAERRIVLILRENEGDLGLTSSVQFKGAL